MLCFGSAIFVVVLGAGVVALLLCGVCASLFANKSANKVGLPNKKKSQVLH
jgi:hypothetical protein